ncbi:MAG: class I tRNA ligase family protein, partial [bacterium]
KFKELGIPCDLYLEGSDQHRGWFQSSLFASMILNDKAPMREILTHGFVVDEKGHKMSKSVGNVISPQEVMTKLSRDILRLWVASADYTDDVIISDAVLKNVTEIYRKVRNTCRFIISNLYDFDIDSNAVEFEKLMSLDKYALGKLYDVAQTIQQAYLEYDFAAALQTLNSYCANDLSALYLDIIKDRLYVEKADGQLRRGAQTVIYHILDVLTKLMAPMLSFLAEEVSDFYQKDKKESIHLQNFTTLKDEWRNQDIESWQALENLRDSVLKSIEEKRAENLIKHSLEAKVILFVESGNEKTEKILKFIKDLQQRCNNWAEFFKNWFIVSQFELSENKNSLNESSMPGIFIRVEHADGVKCPRCWQWSAQPGEDDLCPRCIQVLEK